VFPARTRRSAAQTGTSDPSIRYQVAALGGVADRFVVWRVAVVGEMVRVQARIGRQQLLVA